MSSLSPQISRIITSKTSLWRDIKKSLPNKRLTTFRELRRTRPLRVIGIPLFSSEPLLKGTVRI